jgi:hypothetical protein
MSNISGSSPTLSLSTIFLVAMSHTTMRLSSLQATSNCLRSALSCMCRGRLHRGVEPVTCALAASTAISALSFSEDTNTWPVSRACSGAATASAANAAASPAIPRIPLRFVFMV